MKNDIVIINHNKLEVIKQAISNAGIAHFHVAADFDRTLTKTFINGVDTPSLISVLRTEKMLTPDYSAKAQKLFEKYHAIETDTDYPDDKKLMAMHEWWQKHIQLLIDSRLNKKDLVTIVNSGKLELRDGACVLIKWLDEHSVPLMIFSSSGLGVDMIALYLKKCRRLFSNTHIISNIIKWDKGGYAVGFQEPIIHGMNKGEHALEKYPIFKLIKNRKNILLLGDNPSDLGMVAGIKYDNIIRIGFLNIDVKKNLEVFKQNFDVVITGDENMDYVNKLLEELF